MIVISGTVIVVMILVLLFTQRKKNPFLLSLNKKEHPFYLFYPVGFWLITLFKKKEMQDKRKKLKYITSFAIIYFLILLTFFISFLAEVREKDRESILNDRTIKRPEPGEGGKTYFLQFDSEYGEEEIGVFVEERILTGEQREMMLEEAFNRLKEIILNYNSSFSHITHDLNLVDQIPDTQITVKYQINPIEYMNRKGEIAFENITQLGTEIVLDLTMQYYDTSIQHQITLKVDPQTEKDQRSCLRQVLMEELEQENKKASETSVFTLPEEADGKKIYWSEKKQNKQIIILFLGITGVFLTPFLVSQKEREESEKKKEQMMLDYPELVSKMMLLLNAGMTLRMAWTQIARDYLKLKRKKKNYQRYLYEEMLVTMHELDMGASEQQVYDDFGKRCSGLSFLRLGSVLTQNLKKGNQGIAVLLEEEVRTAFVERKENAKRLGEKASTKLLIPTAGMLIIVIAVIMVPAFLTL